MGTTVDARYQEPVRSSGLRYGIIEVTTRCQCRCPGCYMVRRNALNRGAMSLPAAIRILDLCRGYRNGADLETMDILGGEPLQWPHLCAYVEELIRRGIQPWIFTNMIPITPALAGWLFQRHVHVTGKLNIADPENPVQLALQAEMIGSTTAAAQKMIDAISIFLDAGYRDPLFRLQNLLRKKNLPLIPGYIRYCRSRGIGVDLELMGSGEPVGPEYFAVAPNARELAALIEDLERQGQAWPETSAADCPPEFRQPRADLLMPHVFGTCPFFDKGLYFAVDGTIRACSNSTVRLAHVDDPDPIRRAYESPLICNRRILSRENIGEPCHSCERWGKCRGGCRATVEGTGDPFGGYPLCPLPHLRR